MNENRISFIDIAKGLGILLVIMGHTVDCTKFIGRFIYTFHMPLFFFLSGYVMSDKYLKDGISKRIYPLLLVYLEMCLIGAAVMLSIPSLRPYINPDTIIYSALLLAQPEVFKVGHLWYLISLIWCFAFFIVINNMFRKKKIFALAAALLIFFLIASLDSVTVVFVFGHFQVEDLFKIRTSSMGFLFFELGYLFKCSPLPDRLKSKGNLFKIAVMFAAFLFTLLAVMINGEVNIAMPRTKIPSVYLMGSVSGIVMILALSLLIDKTKYIKKLLIDCGRKTLQILCVHGWFIMFFNWLLIDKLKIGVDANNNYTLTTGLLLWLFISICSLPLAKVFDLNN